MLNNIHLCSKALKHFPRGIDVVKDLQERLIVELRHHLTKRLASNIRPFSNDINKSLIRHFYDKIPANK